MPATLAELAALVNGQVVGNPQYRVVRIGSLENAGADAIAFLAGTRQRDVLAASRAGAIVLAESDRAACAGRCIVVTAPYSAFARIAAHLHPDPPVAAGVHATAWVHPAARVHASAWIGAGAVIDAESVIDERVYIGPLCSVGAGARIGADSRLEGHVSVYRDCVLGQRCRLAAGAVIGADGFGYAPGAGAGWLRIPQTGRVMIGDDVDIGANATIDRGTMDDTVIGNGVKIDNQVQIAHNVQVGEHTIMAAKVGIAGSARIGRRCRIGGRASIAGHLTIVDDVSITATSMVSHSLLKAAEYSSTLTVIENTKWRKVLARIHRLQDLGLRLGALERRLNARNNGEHDSG